MKYVIQLIIISACCGLFASAKSAEASRAGVFYFPLVSCAYSNLDVRDADNSHVTVAVSTDEMVALFRDGLYNAVVNQETFSIAEAQAIIQKILKLSDAWFLPLLRPSVETIVVFIQTVRRFMEDGLVPSPEDRSATNSSLRLPAALSPNNLIALPSLFSVMRC
ncbi:MAG: hypothetical protein ABSH12_09570 [Endomicrobiales bacterium]|jgi:hypothetical protein